MSKPKILVAHSEIPASALAIFGDKYELIFSKSQSKEKPFPSRESLLEDIKDSVGVIWFGHVHVDEEMVNAAGDQLKVIGSMGAGYDHIDVKLLRKKGIKVSNTPNILSKAVADLSVGLALAISRNIVLGYNKIKQDEWIVNHPTWMCGQALDGATVGIIGFGAIGQKIAQRIKAFDIGQLLYYNRKQRPADEENGAKYVTLDDLLRESDFVFLAIPLTPDTANLMNKDKFNLMKESSILINTARGDVVNQEDLVEALKMKKIAGAALDVMTPEPLPHDHPLTTMPNVVLTPHIASATFLARETMAKLAAQNVYNVLNGEDLVTPIHE